MRPVLELFSCSYPGQDFVIWPLSRGIERYSKIHRTTSGGVCRKWLRFLPRRLTCFSTKERRVLIRKKLCSQHKNKKSRNVIYISRRKHVNINQSFLKCECKFVKFADILLLYCAFTRVVYSHVFYSTE